jgi:hypothetical protein
MKWPQESRELPDIMLRGIQLSLKNLRRDDHGNLNAKRLGDDVNLRLQRVPAAHNLPLLSRSRPQHEHRLRALRDESLDVVHPSLKQSGYLPGRGIAKANLNDLRRMASHQSPGQKVIVFCDDDEALGFRKSPDALVVIAREPYVAHVTTARKARPEQLDEPKRKVQVE